MVDNSKMDTRKTETKEVDQENVNSNFDNTFEATKPTSEHESNSKQQGPRSDKLYFTYASPLITRINDIDLMVDYFGLKSYKPIMINNGNASMVERSKRGSKKHSNVNALAEIDESNSNVFDACLKSVKKFASDMNQLMYFIATTGKSDETIKLYNINKSHGKEFIDTEKGLSMSETSSTPSMTRKYLVRCLSLLALIVLLYCFWELLFVKEFKPIEPVVEMN